MTCGLAGFTGQQLAIVGIGFYCCAVNGSYKGARLDVFINVEGSAGQYFCYLQSLASIGLIQ